jgi:predicted ester cyclase
MLSFRQTGRLWGLDPAGAPAVMMGVTHWQVLDGKIVAEWAIYDRIATLAQLVEPSR